VFSYDFEFHRQCQQERMAEMRDEYQRDQASSGSTVRARITRYMRAARSRIRAIPRRAPAYHA